MKQMIRKIQDYFKSLEREGLVYRKKEIEVKPFSGDLHNIWDLLEVAKTGPRHRVEYDSRRHIHHRFPTDMIALHTEFDSNLGKVHLVLTKNCNTINACYIGIHNEEVFRIIEGQLQLSGPISELIPQFKIAKDALSEILTYLRSL